ncbi:MAG: HYR domain-containing protein, partial [Lysobacterales bacterium]
MNRLSPWLSAVLLFLSPAAWAVDCTPDEITLSSQAEVDDFQTNHGPGCDTIITGLTIDGASINDLTPLAGLTTISTVSPFSLNHKLQISNTSLVSLAGLQNLSDVFWLNISNNALLIDTSALSSLTVTRGTLEIHSNALLANLDGFSGVTNLQAGALSLFNNPSLSDLGGLSNLNSTAGSLAIMNNDALANLDGLSALSHVASNISIQNNDILTSISGLSGLTNFTATLDFRFNPQLSSLDGISGVTELSGLILNSNSSLENVDELAGLTTIGNQYSDMLISNNDSLTNLDGLADLVSLDAGVEISDNNSLDACSALVTLLDPIDDALPGPGPGGAGIPDVNGDLLLENNGDGCNSLAEILGANPMDGTGTFQYGSFGGGRHQLLFKGLNLTRNCFDAPIQLPEDGHLSASQVQFACAAVNYMEAETLVYDVAEDRCNTFAGFENDTRLDLYGVFLEGGNSGNSLKFLSDVLFKRDENALLLFDPQSGEILRGQSMVCSEGGGGPPSPPGVLGQLDFLKASNAGEDDIFGDTVAESGDTIVVGTFREDGSAITIDGADDDNATDAGAAYVFIRTPGTNEWTQQAYLKAPNAGAGDYFGRDVDIDGDTVVVGAEREDGDGNASGAAYVFVREAGVWSHQQTLRASDASSSDQFGTDVAVSGNVIVVGAYNEDKAYVFERDLADVWAETIILTGSNTESGDNFGRDVVIDGDTIVVGAFFEDSDATGVGGDEDNNNLAHSGAAYVFIRDMDTWTQQAYLKASNPDNEDGFGGHLAISGDTIAVGVYNEDSNATGIDGNQANNFANAAGAVYVFVRNAGDWSQQAYIKASNTNPNDNFGAEVAVSGDFLVAGAPRESGNGVDGEDDNSSSNSGAVYAFQRDVTSWSQLAYLKASNVDPDDWFGRDVSISGATMVTGAFQEDSNADGGEADNSLADAGAAYVFNITDNVVDPGVDYTPPVVTAPADITGVEATAPYTPVDLGEASVTDDSGESLTATSDFTGPFPVGETTVLWTATDGAGNTGMAEQIIGIVDTTAPMVIAPPDIGKTANGALTSVVLGVATVSDIAGPVQSLINDAPALFPVGQTTVTWTAFDSAGNSGTDTQLVDISPPAISVPEADSAPDVDGTLSYGEWSDASRFNLEQGFLAFTHDRHRLYVLIDVLTDDGDDPFSDGGGDQFWLHFDIDEDGFITPDVDLRFRPESGTGNLRYQTSCDGCGGGFNTPEATTLSSRGEGFGCYFDDHSFRILPLRCNQHRVWELALDLGELQMRSDKSTYLGYLVASGTPLQSENYPSDLNDLENYISLTLEGATQTQSDTGPGTMSPAFEVTQGIQTTVNNIDLVTGKRTAVRVWDSSNTNDNVVKSFIYGSQGGIDLPGSPLLEVSRLSDSYYVADSRDSVVWNSTSRLPVSWSAGGPVDFDVLIRGLDDSAVASLGASIDFRPTRTPVFWTVPIRNTLSPTNITVATGAQIDPFEQYIQRVAPMADIDIVRRPVLNVNNITTSTGLKSKLKDYDHLAILVWMLGLASNGVPPFDLPEQITGFNATGLGNIGGGSSDRLGKGGEGRITWVNQGANRITYLHEINHNIDRKQTSTWGLHVGGCGSQNGGPIDPNWPYGAGTLVTDAGVQIQEVGVFPNTMGTFNSVSDTTPDFMTYCSSGFGQWFSPYRWQAWVDEFNRATPGPDGMPLGAGQGVSELRGAGDGLPIPADSFYLLGRVYPDESGEILQVLRQPGIPDAEGLIGDYRVSVLDCGDAVLAENSFPVSFLGDEGEDEEYFSFGFILNAAAESCTIELLHNDDVLDSRFISGNAPVVTLTTPNGYEEWTGVETVQWTAQDADDDPLLFTLLYSADAGMTWEPLGTRIDANEFEVDSSQLPGSDNAIIRVLASDGVNTGQDDSDAVFSVAGRPVQVRILTPTDGDRFPSTHPIELTGTAMD